MLVTAAEYEILAGLVNGDRNAFNAIYYQYFNAIHRNVFKIIRDVTATEDVVQDVFITLWEKRATIDTSRPLGAWLFAVSYNKSISLLRKKLRDSQALDLLPNTHEDTTVDMSKYELQWQILEKALAQLSPQKRKVFELCKLQGKTCEETALKLHISKYTVKEYLSSAVNYLKEYAHHHPQSSVAVSNGLLLIIIILNNF